MIYLFSIILLFALILMIPKAKEKLNLIKTITIILIVLLAYNTLSCYILNFVNIPITLVNLSIVNFIICSLLIYKIIKDKQIQKYEVRIKDIIFTIIIIVTVCVTIIINFRGISRIRYISMDSVNHYKAAREFSENTTLFNKAIENSTTAPSFLPMAYVNVGILFKIFRPLIGTIDLYKIYILFETIWYLLIGIIFYFLIENKIKTKNQIIVMIAFCIFYLIGYPLNALICGFHYLILGILYFMTIFDTIVNTIENKKIEFIYELILISLLNIGLILSYSLFCPIVYLSEFFYIVAKYRKDKNKLKIILFIIVSLILTGLIGCDMILFERLKEIGQTGISLDGWIYKNNISNIILFIPFALYYIIKLMKQKGKIFEKVTIIFFIIFLILLVIGTKLQLCSDYYLYKNYYILWFLIFYMVTDVITNFIEQNGIKKYVANCFVIIYMFLFSISILFIDTYIQIDEKNDISTNTMEIYTFNKTNMNIDIPFVYKEELQLLEELNNVLQNNWKDDSSILIIGNPTQEKWMQALTGYYNTIYPDIIPDIEKWNNGNYKYLIILEKRELYNKIKTAIKTENAELIYQNEGGKIYIRNGE